MLGIMGCLTGKHIEHTHEGGGGVGGGGEGGGGEGAGGEGGDGDGDAAG